MPVNAIESDVLVVGGGLAGTFAAIKAKEAGAGKVTLVSKGKLGADSISSFAAGVWGGFFPEDDRDAELKRYALSDAWGGSLYDEDWVNILLDESYDTLLDMDRWGVEWEKTPDGGFKRIECRFKVKYAMFHGPQLMKAMAKKVIVSGVEVIGYTMITDLLTENGEPGGKVVGAIGFNGRTGEFRVFKAKAIVLAAGGCGLKGRITCSRAQAGESHTMVYKAGGVLGRFETGECKSQGPQAFDTQGKNMFVGLGATFVNANGERFMWDYDPELRDRASHSRCGDAMAMEVRAGRGPIYLDMTHFTPEDVGTLRRVCPIPTKLLERSGIMVGDRIVKKIEWSAFFMGSIGHGGGAVTDSKCATSLPGLYACGDARARGYSPSALPGAAVTGARAGRFAAEYVKEAKEPELDEKQVEQLRKSVFESVRRKGGIEPDHIIIELGELIFPYEVFTISRGDRMERVIKEIERIREEEVPALYALDPHYLRLANEVRSMVLFAEMYFRSRLLREESRNGCLREDFPYTDNMNWLKWTMLKQEAGKMKLWTDDRPSRNKLLPERKRYLYPVFEVAKKRGVPWG